MAARRLLPCVVVLLALLASGRPADATEYEVGSLEALQARLDAAVPGDTIVLREGSYLARGPLAVTRPGTAAAPVRIAARRRGAVTIGGTAGFQVAAGAEHVEIVGFVFTHAAGTSRVQVGARQIRILHNVFAGTGEGAYLTVAGDDTEIAYNEFRDKSTVGNMIDVRGEGGQIARRVHIHHNYFHDFSEAGGNGAETIRFGLSGLSMSEGAGLIEHNLFVRCTGENELISVKSGGNTIRYNTFLDSPGAQLTLRHGNGNDVYGNHFRGTDGIRIFGDRNRVFSNYLEGNSGGINIGNGGAEVADGAPLTSHDRPDNTYIAFNTLVDNERQYYMTPRRDGLGATGTRFLDNLIQGGGPAAELAGPYPGGVWSGNVLWETEGRGAIPAGGFERVDPRLVRGADGLLRPAADSPLRDSADPSHPVAEVDMDGQRRIGRADRGADEASQEAVVAVPLTEEAIRRIIAEGDGRG